MVGGRGRPESCWWEEDDADCRADCLAMTISSICQRQESILQGHRRHASIYLAYNPVGMAYGSESTYARPPAQVTRNIVRSVCDTATALIGKNLPRPRIVTDGALWDMHEKAASLDKFLVGGYRQGKVYPAAQSSFRDSTVFGTGVYRLVEAQHPNWHVKAKRILPSNFLVDEEECPDDPSDARNFYLRSVMPLHVALEKFGKTKAAQEALRAAMGRTSSAFPGSTSIPKNAVIIHEAWHITDSGPGMYCAAVDKTELLCEEWPHPWPPFVVLYWSPPVSGFYGDGVAYRQLGRQVRINYLYNWVQRCQDLIAVPRVWVDAANGPLKVQVSNEIGEIVGYRGNRPPEFQTPQAVGQELYSWLDALERGGHDDEGISLFSASNQLPVGIESAPAQREYSYKEGQRFAPVSQRWEDAVAWETAHKMLSMYREHYKRGGKPSVKWSDRKLVHQIDWADVDLDTEQYDIRIEASSLADLSPHGRMQAAIDLANTGWIPPEEGRRLMGHPDLERTDKKYNADIEFAEWVSQQLIKGVYVPPSPLGDLMLQMSTVRADYQQCYIKGAPQDILDGQLQFIEECDNLLKPPVSMSPVAADGGIMPPGINNQPASALSIPAAQGLTPMAGTGTGVNTSHQNL